MNNRWKRNTILGKNNHLFSLTGGLWTSMLGVKSDRRAGRFSWWPAIHRIIENGATYVRDATFLLAILKKPSPQHLQWLLPPSELSILLWHCTSIMFYVNSRLPVGSSKNLKTRNWILGSPIQHSTRGARCPFLTTEYGGYRTWRKSFQLADCNISRVLLILCVHSVTTITSDNSSILPTFRLLQRPLQTQQIECVPVCVASKIEIRYIIYDRIGIIDLRRREIKEAPTD